MAHTVRIVATTLNLVMLWPMAWKTVRFARE